MVCAPPHRRHAATVASSNAGWLLWDALPFPQSRPRARGGCGHHHRADSIYLFMLYYASLDYLYKGRSVASLRTASRQLQHFLCQLYYSVVFAF